MIATLWSVPHGPWPGQEGSDAHGFRSAVEILQTMERRISNGDASEDDRRRYRIACATLERGARIQGVEVARVDAEDLLAWRQGEATSSVLPPDAVASFTDSLARTLAGSGKFADTLLAVLTSITNARAGLVITLRPYAGDTAVVRANVRPDRPAHSRSVLPDQALADEIAALPHTADVVFVGDRKRLRSSQILRDQIRVAIATGQVLPIGSQAKHEVLTEVLRELHHPSAPSGAIRLMFAMEGSEARSLSFGSLPSRPARDGTCLTLGLVSMRHTDFDADVSGYWFRNRLVSVPGRSQAETETYCYRDTLSRLRQMVGSGLTELRVRHTGFEPAVIGFYRAVAEIVRDSPLTVRPSYLIQRHVVDGTPWPENEGIPQ